MNVIIYTKNDRYSNNRDKSLFLNSFSLIIFMKNHVRKNLHWDVRLILAMPKNKFECSFRNMQRESGHYVLTKQKDGKIVGKNYIFLAYYYDVVEILKKVIGLSWKSVFNGSRNNQMNSYIIRCKNVKKLWKKPIKY